MSSYARPVSWPDVFVVGAPKCGTTSLYDYLGSHPDVFVPAKKELHYYTRDLLKINMNGPGDEYTARIVTESAEAYAEYFRGADGYARAADVSPSYLYWNQVAPVIADDVADPRIIIMLRDPVEKAYSQYLHQYRAQFEPLTFAESIRAEPERIANGWSDMWYYVRSSQYVPQVQGYLSVFGRDRVHFVITEELASEPQRVMREVFTFLGVSTDHVVTDTRRNATGDVRSKRLARLLAQPSRLKRLSHFALPEAARYRIALRLIEANTGAKQPMPEDVRDSLTMKFRDDVAALEEILCRPLPWRSAAAAI